MLHTMTLALSLSLDSLDLETSLAGLRRPARLSVLKCDVCLQTTTAYQASLRLKERLPVFGKVSSGVTLSHDWQANPASLF